MAAEKETKIFTGEENERLIWKKRCKLFRFGDEQWKQRGTGDVTYLQHIENGNIRIVMRQEKTGKVVMNHYVSPADENKLSLNFNDQKTRVWSAKDFSDGGNDPMTFAIKFSKPEEAAKFHEFFDGAKKNNGGTEEKTFAEYVDPLYADEPAKVDISLEKKDQSSSPAAPEEAATPAKAADDAAPKEDAAAKSEKAAEKEEKPEEDAAASAKADS